MGLSLAVSLIHYGLHKWITYLHILHHHLNIIQWYTRTMLVINIMIFTVIMILQLP